MTRIRASAVILGVVAGLFGVTNAAQLTGRLAGRDAEVVDATVESAGHPPSSPQSLPPNGYIGIELLKTSERELFARLLPATRSRINTGGGEADEGYCYTSSEGAHLAFSLAAFSQFNAIHLSRKPLGDACTAITIQVEECIGTLCLGQTRSEVERLLGIKLSEGDGSNGPMEVAYFHYKVPMSPSERKKFEEFNITEVPVDHNLWFRFDSNGLYYIGIWRIEDLP